MKRILGCAAALVLLAAAPAAAEIVRGGPHADNLHGTSGDDTILAKRGADSVRALAGNDDVFGGPGGDFIIDGGGDDVVKGGAGNDRFNIRRGVDFVFGGVGKDYVLLYHDGIADTIDCGAGTHDLVQYTGDLESHDSFERCERVEAYTPRSGHPAP